MTIQALQMTTPSFGAKLKKNAETENLLNTMDARELKQFKSALKKLDRHHKDDVLELRKDNNPEKTAMDDKPQYYLVNTTNEDKKINLHRGFLESVGHSIVRGIKEASDKGSVVYDALFNDKTEKEKEEREKVLSLMV